jgi:hypothetical protein
MTKGTASANDDNQALSNPHTATEKNHARDRVKQFHQNVEFYSTD